MITSTVDRIFSILLGGEQIPSVRPLPPPLGGVPLANIPKPPTDVDQIYPIDELVPLGGQVMLPSDFVGMFLPEIDVVSLIPTIPEPTLPDPLQVAYNAIYAYVYNNPEALSAAIGVVIPVAGKWKRGDHHATPFEDGTMPSWDTQRKRYWKNRSLDPDAEARYGRENVARMKAGGAPIMYDHELSDYVSMELHHHPVPQREGGIEVIEVLPSEHAEMDKHRHLGGRK